MDSGAGGLTKYKMFIGGEWVDSASGDVFESFNPYTAKPWALMPKGNAAGRRACGCELPQVFAADPGLVCAIMIDLHNILGLAFSSHNHPKPPRSICPLDHALLADFESVARVNAVSHAIRHDMIHAVCRRCCLLHVLIARSTGQLTD